MLKSLKVCYWSNIIILKNCNIVHNGYSLEVSIIGCAADHGVRSKLLCRDDNSEGRCGECSYLFIKNTPYRFLNWECLMKCVPVNSRNFKSFRTTILTALLKNSSELSELGLMSYDNLHNCVGHLKEIISLLISIVSKGDKKEVAEKVSLYTGIRTSTLLHANDCFFYFKGFHWRKLSLHLHDVFLPLCSSEKIRKSLSSLFDMVTEIHIFNYIHWNRESKYFEILRLRYCLLLFMYAYQLRDVFDETQIENLDTVYIHKIFF